MGKKLHKSLRIYFSKLKKNMSLPGPTAATSSLFSACKYPKTPSFAAAGRKHRQFSDGGAACAATLSDVDRFLFENFQSLYIRDDSDSADQSPDDIKPSDRFFASPRTSNSLAEEAPRTSSDGSKNFVQDGRTNVDKGCARDHHPGPNVGPPLTSAASSSSSSAINPDSVADDAEGVPRESVAVVTFSKEPYEDFRRSMQDMVDARHVGRGQPLDWDFMEELLFCYLELNDRAVHKHILRAFADLTVSFRRRIPLGRRKVPATARRRRKKKPPLTEEEES